MNTRKERKSKRPLPLRLLAVMLTCCMLFSSSGFDVLAQVVSDSSYEDDYEQQLAAEEAARKAAEAAAQQQAEEERAAAEAAKAAAKNSAAADAAAAIAQQQANAGAKTSGGMDSSAFGAGETDAYVDNNVSAGSSNNGSISSNTAQVVTDTKLVLKAEGTPDYQAGETAKVKVAYGLGSGCELASVETRLYVWNQTAMFPQFDANGIYVNEDGRTFALKKDSEGDIFVEYMLKPGESFVQEFELADSSVTQGTSIDFDVVICAMGQIPTDQDIQTTPVRVTYALPAEVPEAEGSEPTEIEESEAADAEMTEIDEPAAVEGEPTETEEPAAAEGEQIETEEPAAAEGEPAETEDPAAAEGEQTETEEPAAAEGEPEDIDTFTESTETEETIVNASAPENQTTTEDEEPADESDGEFSEDEESEDEGTDEEGSEDETEYGTEFYYSDGNVIVKAVADPEAKIPADAQLKADLIPVGSEQYNEAVALMESQIAVPEGYKAVYEIYDIYFLVNGEEVEPEEGLVTVTMEFVTPVFEEMKEVGEDYSVLHVSDDNVVSDVTDSVDVNKDGSVDGVGFTTDSFSLGAIRGLFSLVPSDYSISGTYHADSQLIQWKVVLNKEGNSITDTTFNIATTFDKKVTNVTGYGTDYNLSKLYVGGSPTSSYYNSNAEIEVEATAKEVYWEFWTTAPANGDTVAANAKISIDDVSVGDVSGNVTVVNSIKNKNIAATGNTVTYSYIVNEEPYDGTTPISRDSTVDIRLSYTFAEVNKPTQLDNTGYYYNLPDITGLKLVSAATGDIMDPDGNDAGDYRIEGNTVYFDYDANYLKNHPNNIKGTFWLYYSIDKEALEDKDKITIDLGGDQTTIILNDSNVTGTKTYEVDENGNLVFRIVLTAEDADVKNVIVKDKLTGSLEFIEGSFSASAVNKETGVTYPVIPTVSLDPTKKTATITISEIKYGEPVTIIYRVSPNGSGDPTKSANTADWTWEGTGNGTGEGTGSEDNNGTSGEVKVDLDKNILSKTSAVIEKNNQITYTIKINELGSDLIPGEGGEIKLEDVLDPNVTLSFTSIKILDRNGNSLLESGASYSYKSETRTLTVTVPDETYARLIYTVRVNGNIGDRVSVTNKVEMKGELNKSSEITDEVIIQKSEATIEGDAGTISFTKVGAYAVGGSIPNLPGAKFELWKLDLNDPTQAPVLLDTKVTDGAGELTFNKDGEGSLQKNTLYYFVETEAPAGYIKSDRITYFVLNATQETKDKIAANYPSINGSVLYLKDGARLDPISNESVPKPVERQFEAVKTIDGEDAIGSEFSFNMKLTDYIPKAGGYVPENGTTALAYNETVNNNGAKITFPKIKFKYEGTYTFEVTEIAGNSNFLYDSSKYTVTVVVDRDTTGDLKITSRTINKGNEAVEGISFDNIKTTGFSLKKKVTEAVDRDTEFTFKITAKKDSSFLNLANVAVTGGTKEVSNNGGMLIVKVTVSQDATESGNVTVTGIPVGAAVEIIESSKDGWSVTLPSDGKITIDLVEDQSKNSAEFTNSYSANGEWTPTGTKTLEGRSLKNGEFHFEVKENGQVISTGVNKLIENKWMISFDPITYTEEGTHTYTISEKIPGASEEGFEEGIVYDHTVYTVKVTVTDDGDGHLTATPDSTNPQIEFKNSYTASGTWTPTGNKSLVGGAAYGSTEFEFTVTDNNKNQVSVGRKRDADGAIVFDPISYTQDDIGETYTYTIKETSGSRTDIFYDPSEYTVTVTVIDKGNGKVGVDETKVVYLKNGTTVNSADFINRYKASGSGFITGTKTLENRALAKGDFTFGLYYDESGTNPVKVNAEGKIDSEGTQLTGTNEADGRFRISTPVYSQEDIGKTYTYYVREIIPPSEGNYSYDKRTFQVLVSIKDAGNGVLNVTPSYQITGPIAFKNVYNAKGVLPVSATKSVIGRTDVPNIFKFELYNTTTNGGRSLIETVSNDGSSIKFKDIEYSIADKDKTYTYELVEKRENAGGYTYSTEKYVITAKITDKGNGELNVEKTITKNGTIYSGTPEFTNIYEADGDIVLTGKKVLENRKLDENQFQFQLYSIENYDTDNRVDSEVGSPVSNSADGTFTFPKLEFDQDDVSTTPYYYAIKEVDTNPNGHPGYTYFSGEVIVAVTVTDKGNGELNVSAVPNGVTGDDAIVISNVYEAEGSLVLNAHKTLNGRKLLANQFTFTLIGSKDVRQEKTNDINGNVTFDEITYDETDIGKKYQYTIKETDTGDDGYKYSTDEYIVNVEVVDNGNGTLSTPYTITKNGNDFTSSDAEDGPEIPEFTNIYEAEGKTQIKGVKNLVGGTKPLNAGDFSFKIYEVKNGTEIPLKDGGDNEIVVSNDVNGNFEFPVIYYDESQIGSHVYRVKEVNDGKNGYTYDTAVMEITVMVSDNGDGILKANQSITRTIIDAEDNEITSVVDSIIFENIYKAEGAFTPTAKKVLEGRKLEAEQFRFELTGDGITEPVVAKNDGSGNVVFSNLEYDENNIGQTYWYQIKEVLESKDGYTYSTEIYKLKITVTDNNGKLDVKGTYYNSENIEVNKAVFTNSYKADTSIFIEGTKKLTGNRSLDERQFSFKMTEDPEGLVPTKDENGNDMVVSNDSLGNFKFPALKYDQDDVKEQGSKDFDYYISEVGDPTDNVYDYSNLIYKVTVHVTDNQNGTLSAKATIINYTENTPEESIVFENHYNAYGKLELTAIKKLITGSDQIGIEKGQFTFELAGSGEHQIKKNDADGRVIFDAIEYDETDINHVYAYTVSEHSENKGGFSYSNEIYIVMVKITDNRDGSLKIEETITNRAGEDVDRNKLLFENEYHAYGYIDLTAEKVLNERKLKDQEFTFILSGDGVEQTKKNDGSGEIAFDRINYTEKDIGEHIYTVKEVAGNDGTVFYDDTEYTVTVKVSDNKNGTLKTEVTKILAAGKEEKNISFWNDVTKVEISKIEIVETAEGEVSKELPGAKLELKDADGNVIDTWISGTESHVINGVLEAGKTYTLTEITAPDGYQYAEDVHFTVNEDGTVKKVVMEDELVEITISKMDSEINEELEGAELKIVDNNGDVAKTIYGERLEWVSDGTPKVIRGLKNGDYKLVETTAPAGYRKALSIDFTINNDGELISEPIVMEDTPTEVTIRKTDLTTGEELPGATLQILVPAAEGEEPTVAKTIYGEELEWVSGREAKVIKGLPAGDYILHEVSAPAGYIVAEDIPFTITDDLEAENKVTMEDASIDLRISKTDIITGKELPGATLQVLIPAEEGEEPAVAKTVYGEVLEWETTDAPKEIKGLPAGEYILKETAAPNGYTIAGEIRFTVDEDGSITSDAYNEEMDTIVMEDVPTEVTITKTDITTDEELPGATLQVLIPAAEGEEPVVATTIYGETLEWVSGAEAKVIKGLPAGDYILREISAPYGYTIAKDVEFTITNELGVQEPVVMKNAPTELEITKTGFNKDGESVGLEGAKLEIRECNDDESIGDIVTNVYNQKLRFDSTEGAFKLEGIRPGTYWLVETEAPAGYTIADPIKIEIEEDMTVSQNPVEYSMVNVPTEVTIRKTDLTTGEELPGATLQILVPAAEGEEPTVAKTIYGEELEWVSGETAKVIKGLPAGDYILHEVSAPAGYIVAEDIPFTITDDLRAENVVEMEDGATEVVITKKDITNGEELPGALLQVLEEVDDELVVAETVYGEELEWESTEEAKVIKGLEAGDYILREITAPDGFTKAADIAFHVDEDGHVTSEALDKETGEIVMNDAPTEVRITKTDITNDEELPGAVLQVLIPAEEGKEPAVATTVYGEKLEWTSTEEAKEIEGLPAGDYILREITAPDGFTIANDVKFTVTDELDVVAEVTMKDAPVELHVTKTGFTEDGKSVILAGAKMEIRERTAENGTGDIAVNVYGQELSFVSAEEAVVLKGVKPGDYWLVETEAPAGYTIAEPIEFTVKEDMTVIQNPVSVVMQDGTTQVTIRKTDITTGKELPGATLQILKQEGEELAVAQTIYGEKLEWVSGDIPKEIKGLGAGDYILREISAPNGYTVAEDVKFTITDDLEVAVKVVMENAPTEVSISKTDLTGKEELPGAKLQVLKQEGDKLTVVETIYGEKLEWISGEKPKEIKGIPAGDYILRETAAPDGYTVAEDVKFTLTDDLKAVNKVTMNDAPTEVSIRKTDITTGKELPGATLQVLKKEGNELVIVETIFGEKLEWVSGEEAKVIEGLPAGDYILREITAPDGFTVAEDVDFTVTDELGVVEKVVMEDTPIRLEISKTGFTKDGEVVALEGAKLEIRERGEDNSIGDIVTNAYGEKMRFESSTETVALNGVKPGNYWLVETNAPEGYTIADPIEITINEDMTVSQNPVTLIMEDCPTEVSISKTDITTGKELPGATLQVLKPEGEELTIVETIYGEKLEWVSGNTPKDIKGLAAGDYILREITAPEGYAVAEDVPFTITDDLNVENKVVMEDQPTEVTISKREMVGVSELPGASLLVLDENGEIATTIYGEKLEWVSGETAKVIRGLKAGNYTLVETESPDGYVVAESIEFEVKDGEFIAQKVIMRDDTTKVQISKMDITNNAELAGAHLVLKDEAGEVIAEWTSTGKPKEINGQLIVGATYTLSEISAPAGYDLAKDITFTVDNTGEIQKVVMEDKVSDGKASITVQKLVMMDGEFIAIDYTFYVALFADKECTERVTNVKPLEVSGSYTTSTIFNHLQYGTYYVAETDEYGNAISEAEFVEAIEVLDGMATLTPTNATAKSIIINHIAGFNPGYYKDGEITVDKRVLIDGKEGNVTDKFYFALFTDAALTIMSDAGIRELELNNESGGTVKFENLPYGEYYLAETNKDGVPVDDTFAYNVTISSYCKVDGENRSVTRTVVNALENEKDKDKEENKDGNDTTPTPTPASSTTYSSSSGGGGSTSTTAAMTTYTTGTKPAKTGDETPIGLYLFLLSVSGILLIGGYGRKRRRRSK